MTSLNSPIFGSLWAENYTIWRGVSNTVFVGNEQQQERYLEDYAKALIKLKIKFLPHFETKTTKELSKIA